MKQFYFMFCIFVTAVFAYANLTGWAVFRSANVGPSGHSRGSVGGYGSYHHK